MKNKLTIIKIGGNLIDNENQLTSFITDFAKLEGLKILVHGGGKKTSELSIKLGFEPLFIDGRRITSQNELEIATMVYAGLINKNITSKLQAAGCNALGLTGADANMIQSKKREVNPIDFGFVGDINHINIKPIQLLLNNHITPVFCAITHDTKGQLFNTNADTVAAELAIALSTLYETTLYYCFEKQGVLMNINLEDSVIPLINSTIYTELKKSEIITKGMLPKLENSFQALHKGVTRVIIGNADSIKPTTLIRTTIVL